MTIEVSAPRWHMAGDVQAYDHDDRPYLLRPDTEPSDTRAQFAALFAHPLPKRQRRKPTLRDDRQSAVSQMRWRT